MVRKTVKIGLALGGLAGNNAYGAGVLQAALERNLKVDIISCTSGQIYWVSEYLRARSETPANRILRDTLQGHIDRVRRTKVDIIDTVLLALTGVPKAFRPALLELPLNVAGNLSFAFSKIITSATENWHSLFSAYRELSDWIPSKTLVPLFDDEFYRSICEQFHNASTLNIGIVFNSYDVSTGVENIYLNEYARDLLEVQYFDQHHHRRGSLYRPISPEAVREGLWIYEYGAPHNLSAIDGAYYRQVMLSELMRAETVYVVRPINSRWFGSFPTSWVGLQDLKTEINFNGSYAGERDKHSLMNQLLEDGAITQEMIRKKGYHKVELIELEIQTQRGFFDYAYEHVKVFDEARQIASQTFSMTHT